MKVKILRTTMARDKKTGERERVVKDGVYNINDEDARFLVGIKKAEEADENAELTPYDEPPEEASSHADDLSSLGENSIKELMEAIRMLDKSDPKHFTNDGKPHVKVLEALVKFDISAAQRDAVWEKYQQENPAD